MATLIIMPRIGSISKTQKGHPLQAHRTRSFARWLAHITDPGSVIYKHVRVRLWGRKFTCFKFRTMVVDSENVLKALVDADPGARTELPYHDISD